VVRAAEIKKRVHPNTESHCAHRATFLALFICLFQSSLRRRANVARRA
jgi:hypothetical protein